ncbi:MAG: hypothetical protein RJB38_789 [Pseudomonadota bacterium]
MMMMLAPWTSEAGIASKIIRPTDVFRVGENGKAVVVGSLKPEDAIEILGYRPDFEWVRIAFEKDEGYVSKAAMQDPGLQNDYFDPASSSLGRKKDSENFYRLFTEAKARRENRFGLSATLASQSPFGLGVGGGVLWRQWTPETWSRDWGAEALFYWKTTSAPLALNAFFRAFTPGDLKIGLEALGTLKFSNVSTETGTATQAQVSGSAGLCLGLALSPRTVLLPGIRVPLNGESVTAHFTLSFTP